MFTRIRQHPRLPTEYQVQCRFTDIGEMNAYVLQNISMGGAFIQTPTLPEKGSQVSLALTLESGEEVFLVGVVVRHQTGEAQETGFAMEFDESGDDMLARLRAFMREVPMVTARPPVKPELEEEVLDVPLAEFDDLLMDAIIDTFGDIIFDREQDHAEAFVEATDLFNQFKFMDAARACYIAFQLDSNNAEYATFLGCSLYMLGDQYLDLSDYYLFKSLELDPNHAEAHLALGYRYKDCGDLPKAIHHFKASHALEPSLELAAKEYQLLSQRVKE